MGWLVTTGFDVVEIGADVGIFGWLLTGGVGTLGGVMAGEAGILGAVIVGGIGVGIPPIGSCGALGAGGDGMFPPADPPAAGLDAESSVQILPRFLHRLQEAGGIPGKPDC